MSRQMKSLKTYLGILAAVWLALCFGAPQVLAEELVQETAQIEEAASLTDLTGDALPRARTAYSSRKSSQAADADHWYGDQLTTEVEKQIYAALMEQDENIREVGAAYARKSAGETLPTGTPYYVPVNLETPVSYLEANKANDEAYLAFRKSYTRAWQAYSRDCGEQYWINGFTIYFLNTSEDKTTGIKTVRGLGFAPAEYYKNILTEDVSPADDALQQAVAAVNKADSYYDKVKAAHDYVVELIEYNHDDIDYAPNHTLTGGLLGKYDHLAVCECYAKLFRELCDACDIPCILISGGSTKNTDGSVKATHMWNYVQMDDGGWYLVDPTWDDTARTDKYFLMGTSDVGTDGRTMESSHMPIGNFCSTQSYVAYTSFSVPQLSLKSYEEKHAKLVMADEALTVKAGESKELPAVTYAFGSGSRAMEYTYATSDAQTVEVDEAGNVTGKSAGEATITIKNKTRIPCSAECKVTVTEETTEGGDTTDPANPTDPSNPGTTEGGDTTESTNPSDPTNPTDPTDPSDPTTNPDIEPPVQSTETETENIITDPPQTEAQPPQTEVQPPQTEVPAEPQTEAQTERAFVFLNANTLPLQVKRSTSALKVTDCKAGDRVVSWTSNKPKIVAVNRSTGRLTAKKAGKATITVEMASGASAKCIVTAQKGVVKTKKLMIGKTSLTLKRKKSYKLSVTRTPLTANDKLTYQSSNKRVAAVSASGKITAKKKGAAKITIRAASGKKLTVKVIVK